MAAEDLKIVWVPDARGEPKPYHEVCARKQQLEGSPDGGKYYHTAICHICARWLDSPPEEKKDGESA